MTWPRGPFLTGAGMGGGGDNGEEISGIKTPFKVPVLPIVYSTIRSILIRDEEHHLSPITSRVLRQACRPGEDEMRENS